MNSSIIKRAANFIRQQKKNKAWHKIVGSLAVLVVFVTTYMLILPAITMEEGPSCGKEEHVHTEECYAAVSADRVLTCPYENSEITVIHQHDGNCFDAYGNFICTLPAVPMHQHTEACYASEIFLTCMMEEGEGHIHTDECYTEDGMLICPLEESVGHVHGPECYQTESYLACGQDEVVPHIHGVDCQIQPDELFFDCGMDEAIVHQHDENCFTTVGEDTITLVCGQEEHTHDPACYPTNVMTKEENTEVISEEELTEGTTEGQTEEIADEQYEEAAEVYSDVEQAAETEEQITEVSEPAAEVAEQNTEETAEAEEQYTEEAAEAEEQYTEETTEAADEATSEETEEITTEESVSETTEAVDEEVNPEETEEVAVEEQDETDEIAEADETEESEEEAEEIEEFSEDEEEDVEIEEAGTTFKYEDATCIVTATVSEEANIPKDAEFKVTLIPENSLEYAVAEQRVQDYISSDDKTLRGMILYDMHFEFDGTEVEPDSSVQVQVQYKEAVQISEKAEETTEEDMMVLHLLDPVEDQNIVEDVTQTIATNEANEIEEAVFETESFSQIAIVKILHPNAQNWITPGTTVSFLSVLGDSVYYGITANEIIKDAHMDTTFAVKTFTSNGGNITTGKYTASKPGAIWIGQMTGILQIDGGLSTEVICPDDVKEHLTLSSGSYATSMSQQDVFEYVDMLMNKVRVQSELMASQTSTAYDKEHIDSNEWNEWVNKQKKVDFTMLPAGTYYLDGDFFFGSDLNDISIALNGNQNVVFNFNSATPTLKQFKCIVDDVEISSATNTGTVEALATRVIFNMPNATDLYIQSAIAGVVIAPNATLHGLGGTSSGWLVVDTLERNNSEWHFIYQSLPERIPVRFNISGTKKVEGQVPDEKEVFNFALSELEEGEWKLVESKPNSGSNISFSNITYSEGGTHYYLVEEVQENKPGYILDNSKYVFKVIVTATSDVLGNIKYKKETHKYCVDLTQELLNEDGTINVSALTEDTVSEVAEFNNHKEEESDTSIEVEKVWKKADGTPLDASEYADKSITINVYQWVNGVKTEQPYISTEEDHKTPIILSQQAGWSKTLNNLPLVRIIDGQTVSYSYTFEEVEVEGFDTTYSRGTGNNPITDGKITITNEKQNEDEDTSITVKKVWKDVNGETPLSSDEMAGKTITITLHTYIDGVEQSDTTTYNLPYNNSWERTITDLPKIRYVDGAKHEYSYLITEAEVTGFNTSYSTTVPVVEGEIVITNTKNTTDVSVEKIWTNTDGTQTLETPLLEEITVDLYQVVNGNATPFLTNIKLSATDSWKFTRHDLPYKDAEGNLYTYYFVETTTGSYITTYTVKGSTTIVDKTNPAETAISDGTIIINNKKNAEYALPETGGHGTTMYTLSALLMFGLAMLLMYKKAQRKEID